MRGTLILTLFLGALATAGLSGCSPIGVVVGAGAAVATASEKEKGLGRTVDDTVIRAKLNGYFFEKDAELYRNVRFVVEEGRVLLTGEVESPQDRVEATRLSWSVDGVAEVINEIQVTNKSTLTDFAKDNLIAAQIRGRVLLDQDIRSINFSFDVVNQTVYVIGVARSHDELKRVLGHARAVSYVKTVVDYVRVKG